VIEVTSCIMHSGIY